MVEPGKLYWIDISIPIRNGMVHWPDDPPVVIERVSDMERSGIAVRCSALLSVQKRYSRAVTRLLNPSMNSLG